MSKAKADIYIDKTRPRKNGECSVKIKVTYLRKRKYYPTNIYLTPDEYEKVFHAERKTKKQKENYDKILYYQNKATDVINKKLIVFTFDNFEQAYFEQRNITNSVSFAFDKYIEQLINENRIATAESYRNAKRSLESFKTNLSFADITPAFLKKYENWMIKKGKSITTVGIYLRSLRAIYNLQNIDRSIYPFGESKKLYSIPTGKNTKKALTIDEVAKIFNHKVPANTNKEMAKDYWIFMYLCNGMNVKDFCLLKWSNIKDDMIIYNRAKTKRTQRESKSIVVALKPETKAIIKKWGQLSVIKETYIFSHLKPGMTAIEQQATIKQLTKTINKYMKRIAIELNINKPITTYYARHSFATVLKRSGASIELISELLGHSNVGTTESYLDSFEKEQIQEQTNNLTVGFSKAN